MRLSAGLLAALLVSAAWADGPSPLAREIAKAHGIDGWDQVEAVRFTFNVQRGEKTTSRSYEWWPKKDLVTQTAGDKSVTVRRPMAKQPGRSADEARASKQFINDSYWLLFPFQLVWSDPDVTDAGMAALPIGDNTEKVRKVVCQWPDEGGYTPGDAYDLYMNSAGLIEQWVFRRGGKAKGNAMTWAGYVKLGPVSISTYHRNAKGNFALTFTGLSIKLEGQDEWIGPEVIPLDPMI